MPYIQLAAAIVLELCGTTFLKMSEGFTKLGPSVLCMVLYFFCFFIFSKEPRRDDCHRAHRRRLCALKSFRHRAVNGVFSAGLRACCFL